MEHERTVLALFERRESADQAISDLVKAGFEPEHVGYLEPTNMPRLKDSTRGALEGIAVGGSSGAVLGGVLVAVAVGLIPGIGPALAGGSLLSVVLGAAAGGMAGAEVGGLLGAEIDEEQELFFMEEVQAGRILVSVETEREQEATALLRSRHPLEVDSLGTAALHARLRHPQPASQVRAAS